MIQILRKELDFQTLEERRLQQRLTFFYKVINGEVVVTTDDLGLEVADIRIRAAHCHKFKENEHARTSSSILWFIGPFQSGTVSPPRWRRPAHLISSRAG